MHPKPRRGLSAALGASLVAAVALALPGSAAAAASKPTVKTGPAADRGQSTVTLTGTVNPNGARTTYFFQIGTTTLYGVDTPEAVAGSGTADVAVSAYVDALAPATTYNYRLVARNSKGLTKGPNRRFTTRRQPLGLSLSAQPATVPFMGSTALVGALSGTGNAGQQVVLQSNPFPYTQGFASVGNALVTADDGGFTFPLLALPLNTQYRVVMPERPAIASPIVTVGVKVRVHMNAVKRRIKRGRRANFSGTIRPAADGSRIVVQKRRKGKWVTVAATVARKRDAASSSFRRRVKLRSGGRFRVRAQVTNGRYVSANGRAVRIRVRR